MLLVCISVGGCLCYIYSSACQNVTYSLKFIYKAPSLAFAAEYINALMIFAITRMASFFGDSGESLDMKKWPSTLLLAFVSDR